MLECAKRVQNRDAKSTVQDVNSPAYQDVCSPFPTLLPALGLLQFSSPCLTFLHSLHGGASEQWVCSLGLWHSGCHCSLSGCSGTGPPKIQAPWLQAVGAPLLFAFFPQELWCLEHCKGLGAPLSGAHTVLGAPALKCRELQCSDCLGANIPGLPAVTSYSTPMKGQRKGSRPASGCVPLLHPFDGELPLGMQP